jgi:hypothetical protein
VLLSNRGDAGFDSRTLTAVGFPAGTLLIELTGNAADKSVNPDRGGQRDIPEVLRVFQESGVSKVNVRFQRPGTMMSGGNFNFHGKGLLVYGLPVPESKDGIELSNVDQVLAGNKEPRNPRENGTERQTDISVIRKDSFQVRLQTQPVRVLGSNDLRDVNADGDEALLRMDGGLDLNGNGTVDFKTPGQTEYGFERFVTKHDPLIRDHDVNRPRGGGEFSQVIDATKLAEGMHFLTARVYRHQPSGSPAVFADFKKVLYVDRTPPESVLESMRRLTPAGDAEVVIRSVDFTADSVHVFANLPATTTDAQVIADARQGNGRLDRVDRALFRGTVRAQPRGNTLRIVTFESTGTTAVNRANAVIE